MDYKDYYHLLGIEKSATKEEIKKKYRTLARKYHPDKNQDNKIAEEKFKEIQEAYEVLGNEQNREKYDRLGANWKQYANAGDGGYDFSERTNRRSSRNYRTSFGGGEGFSDFFQSFFDGGFAGNGAFEDSLGNRTFQYQQAKGRDYKSEININLSDACKGTSTLLNVDGEKIKIILKPGIKNGQTVRVKGKGAKSPGGGPNGDLLLKVNVVNNSPFTVEGNDLKLDLHVDLYTAILGGKISFNTFANPISINLPPETPNEKILRLKGKGMPVFGKPELFGDLYIKIIVSIPQNLSDEERELFSKLANLRK